MPKVRRRKHSLLRFVMHVTADKEFFIRNYFTVMRKSDKKLLGLLRQHEAIAAVYGNTIVIYNEDFTDVFTAIGKEYELYSGKNITVILDKPSPLDPEVVR